MIFIDPKTYYQNLPKKSLAAAALIYNQQKEILILKTSYRKYWTLPGGVVEKDESVKRALVREIKEEINLDLADFKLAALDYCATKIIKGVQNPESVQVLFDAGVVTKEILDLIKIDNQEIIEYQFCTPEDTLKLLGLPLRRMLHSYLISQQAVYLENGIIV